MKILHVTWGFPPDSKTGGVTVYLVGLAEEQLQRGHQIFVFYASGVRRSRGKSYLSIDTRFGMEVAKVANGPNNYVGAFGTEYDPLKECSNIAVERLFDQYLERVRPDVVHIQTLVGLSASLLQIAHDRGAATVVTLHDYWFICPRVQLLQPDGTICPGPLEGFRCATCVAESRWRRWLRVLFSQVPWRERISAHWKAQVRSLVGGTYATHVLSPSSVPADSPRNYNRFFAVQNCIRTQYLRGLLCNQSDIILTPSRFVCNVFVSHGVSSDRIRVCRPGVRDAPSLSSNGVYETVKLSGDVMFGYLGAMLPHKGVYLLATAFHMLGDVPASLVFHSHVDDITAARLRALCPTGRLTLAGAWERSPEALARILADIDIVVMPSMWYENAPTAVQEAQAAAKPILAARIGGLPELIKDGVNGLLFTPGDANDLAQKMKMLIENPDLRNDLKRRAKQNKVKSMVIHADEILGFYQEAINLHR